MRAAVVDGRKGSAGARTAERVLRWKCDIFRPFSAAESLAKGSLSASEKPLVLNSLHIQSAGQDYSEDCERCSKRDSERARYGGQ